MAVFAAGALVATWLSFFCLYWDSDWQWRFIVLFQCVAPSLLLVGVFFAPESPRWLIHKDKREEALDILAKYHANGDVDELVQQELIEIVSDIQREKDAQSKQWRALFESPGNRHRMLIVTLAISGSTILGSKSGLNISI